MPQKPPHVLIVDDNEDLLLMLKTMLTLQKYQVSVKKNIDNLLSSIRSISPDIIIMDMLLSGGDGREACRSLKSTKDLSLIPVLMISAHPQAEEKCLAAGADHFIQKPFEMKDLLQTVSDLAQGL